MKSFSLLAAVVALGLTLTMPDAEAAKRLGAGGSSGMQRNMDTPAKAPAAAPAQAPTASAAARAPATAAQAAQPKRSWMGPLAGLAAGLGLAALASHLGFGEELASMMMIGLLVMAVLVVVGLVMRRRAAAQQPALAGAAGMQYAASGAGAPAAPVHAPSMPAAGRGALQDAAAPAAGLPADFDAAAFARQAKVNFIRLQAANDAANLDDLRQFTTPEMFAELKMNIAERGGQSQQTDVVDIDAEVLEVVEETARYVVSVRFAGLLREQQDGPVEPIDEIWHLTKPRDGADGWRLAGIQQRQ